MSDETTEAILGDAVAASLEKPDRQRRGLFGWKKRAQKEGPPLTHCEDCGAELHGRYCSNCGQVAVDYHRSFRHVIADVAESFLNWDSKFTKTIGLLLIRPGWLTSQFVAGRRTRYLHPLRLYLLVSIAFFLAARLIPVTAPTIDKTDLTPGTESAVAKSAEDTADAAPQTGPPAPSKSVKKNRQKLIVFDDHKGPQGPFQVWMDRQVKAKLGEDGTKLQLFAETLRSNISTMMLFCIPLFAFVLKILYLRQRRFYIEHLIYALHIHSFFYIAVLVTIFSSMAAERWVPALQTPLILILWVVVVVQIFLSIRQVYRQSWFMTTFKFFFGGFIYLFVLISALAITAIATFALP